jgi:hypothetical protein
MIVEV